MLYENYDPHSIYEEINEGGQFFEGKSKVSQRRCELNLKVIIKNKVKIMTISKKINEINNCLKKNSKQSPQMY